MTGESYFEQKGGVKTLKSMIRSGMSSEYIARKFGYSRADAMSGAVKKYTGQTISELRQSIGLSANKTLLEKAGGLDKVKELIRQRKTVKEVNQIIGYETKHGLRLALKIHNTTYTKLYKEIHGVGFKEHRGWKHNNKICIYTVKHYLKRGYSIKRISDLTGMTYRDIRNIFFEKEGMSPSDYKQKHYGI